MLDPAGPAAARVAGYALLLQGGCALHPPGPAAARVEVFAGPSQLEHWQLLLQGGFALDIAGPAAAYMVGCTVEEAAAPLAAGHPALAAAGVGLVVCMRDALGLLTRLCHVLRCVIWRRWLRWLVLW